MFTAKQIPYRRYKLVARFSQTDDGVIWNYDVVEISTNTVKETITSLPVIGKDIDITNMQMYVDELNYHDQTYLKEIQQYTNNK